MKKTFALILTFVILCSMCVMSFATKTIEYDGNSYDIGGKTIIFTKNNGLTQEEELVIANIIINDNNQISVYGIGCLFGHSYEVTNVTVIHHKERETSPRCLAEETKISRCTKCDKIKTEVLASYYINCC